jgi:Fe-S cluster biogenesis protein NfuA
MNAIESIAPNEVQQTRFVSLNGSTRKSDQKDAASRLEELFAQLDSIPNLAARELASESIQSVVTLYGEALGRVVKLVGRDGGHLMAAVLKDELLRSLLLVHDLHPQSLDERLLGALESVRPYLNSHGGNIEVLEVHDGIARLRFQGTCKTCPSSAVTLELAIRRAVIEACPDLIGLELEQSEIEGSKK